MKASILDMRRRMAEVLQALDRNEPVTITYRGKKKAVLQPARREATRTQSASAHAAFGMWKDMSEREMRRRIREVRKGRVHDV